MEVLNEYETPIKHGKAILRIYPDVEPCNPRTEWENLTIIACKHKRYNLGDNTMNYINKMFIDYDRCDDTKLCKYCNNAQRIECKISEGELDQDTQTANALT